MAVTLNLTPELEKQLVQEAQENGIPLSDYVQSLMQKTLKSRGVSAHPARPKYDREAMLALLDEFENNHEMYGTAQEQHETLAYLKIAIDADRPGQRSIFGEGRNPE